MLIESGNDNKRFRLGKMSNLKIVTTTTNTNNTTTKRKTPPPPPKTKTRTMKISEPVYELLRNHSRKYYDQPISYDEILEELCTFYNQHHEQKWF